MKTETLIETPTADAQMDEYYDQLLGDHTWKMGAWELARHHRREVALLDCADMIAGY